MARPIWKGQISFGLVNVPVTLYSAEQSTNLSFKLIDNRNSARIRYERVNEVTGEEVPWDQIVKGYEYDDDNYVLISKEEMENASPELTKTIEIEQFVKVEEIDPIYFDKPYYLVPNKGAEKGYVLLRETMKEAERVGIAQVVIRSRGHLAAMMPRGNALILDLLRYSQEVRNLEDYNIPEGSLKDYEITQKELKLAGQLVEGMSADWEPGTFRDEYRDALMSLIERRIGSSETETIPEGEAAAEEDTQTINFMDQLKKSVEKTSKKSSPRKSSSRKKSSRSKKAS